MAKTYEALNRAGKEQNKSFFQPVAPPEKAVQPYVPKHGLPDLAPEWCQELRTRLLLDDKDRSMKVILFTGTSKDCGCTTTAAWFAVYLANILRKKVLLLDLDLKDPGIHRFFQLEDISELRDVLDHGERDKPSFFQAFHGNLCLVTCNGSFLSDAPNMLRSDTFAEFLDRCREEYDFVLIDSASVTVNSETRLLGNISDGVILMVEAGRSRRSVVMRAKKEIESAGGNLIGTILNRRKFFIPKWLYRRL